MSGTLRKSCIVVASGLLLAGCVSNDMTDLEQHVASVMAREGGRIDPLPPIKPYEPYLYQSAERGERDPFLSFMQTRREQVAAAEAADSSQRQFTDEILTHVAEELENFPLDSLRMVGIMERDNERWGIIKDPSGTVHRVQVGNYMGNNYGRIQTITEAEISLREIIQDAQGRWEERVADIALSEE